MSGLATCETYRTTTRFCWTSSRRGDKKWTERAETDDHRKLATTFRQNSHHSKGHAILHHTLEKQGWRGIWVDTYRNCFRQDYWNTKRLRELPEADSQALLDKIRQARNGRRAGTWDVFCWRDGKYLFAESKRFGHDKFRRSQLEWLEAALSLGLPLDSFLIVEWTL